MIMRRLYILAVTVIMLSCSSDDKVLIDEQRVKTVDVDSLDASYEPYTKPVNSEEEISYQSSDSLLIGKILVNLEDTTLLKLVYGSYAYKDDKPYFNAGPKIWDDQDSVYVYVAERLGNDSVQVIYLRGEMAITTRMHNHFHESVLMLVKEKKGWKVADASVQGEAIDYNAVKFEGFFGRQMLLQYETFGVYAGGVDYGEKQFMLLTPGSLKGQNVRFVFASSNTASDQCFADPETNRECDCYSHDGKITYAYNQKWKCLVFDYVYNQVNMQCEGKNPKGTVLHQRLCMNADTSFLSFDSDKKIRLTEKQIQRYLK
jgi:hypothetical protein